MEGRFGVVVSDVRDWTHEREVVSIKAIIWPAFVDKQGVWIEVAQCLRYGRENILRDMVDCLVQSQCRAYQQATIEVNYQRMCVQTNVMQPMLASVCPTINAGVGLIVRPELRYHGNRGLSRPEKGVRGARRKGRTVVGCKGRRL